MNPNYRNLALWAIIAVLLIALFNLFQAPQQRGASREMAYSEFLQELDAGRVKSVTIAGDRITGTYGDSGAGFQTYSPGDATLVQRLEDKGVTINARPETDGSNSIIGSLISWVPMLLILGVWIFFMRQMQSGSGRAGALGHSRIARGALAAASTAERSAPTDAGGHRPAGDQGGVSARRSSPHLTRLELHDRVGGQRRRARRGGPLPAARSPTRAGGRCATCASR